MSLRSAFAAPIRRTLRAGATRWPWFRRGVTLAAREFDRALHDDTYGSDYYLQYSRESTHANAGAYLIWRWFPVHTTLDVGCAFGWFVEAQREIGIEAFGVDVSQFAIDHASPGAHGHVRYGNLVRRLPFSTGEVELVSAFETLEHVPPRGVPKALQEIRRVASKYVVATIPSFGPNEHGPGGWFDVKVRPERLDHYRSLGDGYTGPVPYADLYRDERGEPVEGHLTIASFDWWTDRFREAGFVRCGAVERRIHPHLARFGLTKYWNLYVFRVAGVPDPPMEELRTPDEIAALEKRWALGNGPVDADDFARVRAALGEDCFD